MVIPMPTPTITTHSENTMSEYHNDKGDCSHREWASVVVVRSISSSSHDSSDNDSNKTGWRGLNAGSRTSTGSPTATSIARKILNKRRRPRPIMQNCRSIAEMALVLVATLSVDISHVTTVRHGRSQTTTVNIVSALINPIITTRTRTGRGLPSDNILQLFVANPPSPKKHSDPLRMYEEERLLAKPPSSNQRSNRKTNKTRNNDSKIEVVNFRQRNDKTNQQRGHPLDGQDINDDNDDAMLDPWVVPSVSTLDPYDGPLPIGCYIRDGKEQYDAKPTCRIGIGVNYRTGNNDKDTIDPDRIVQRLQDCIDTGFNTFQMTDQDRQGLDIIKRLKQQTPSYVEHHWIVTYDLPTSTSGPISPGDIRQHVVDMLEQTQSDAIDSLQIQPAILSTVKQSISPYTMDVVDTLADLQREGLIRSIGVRNLHASTIRKIQSNFSPDLIDHQQHDGNLMLPPTSGILYDKYGLHDSEGVNLWLRNPLASGLLSESYNTNPQWTNQRLSSYDSTGSLNDHLRTLREWATRRHHDLRQQDQHSLDSSSPVLDASHVVQDFQKDVSDRLSWVALKHQVSMSSVAIRWSLECGGQHNTNLKKDGSVLVSSTIIDCVFDGGEDDDLFLGGRYRFRPPIDFREVFTFDLDDEDKALLLQCSADWRLPENSKKREMNKYEQSIFENYHEDLLSQSDRDEMASLQHEFDRFHNTNDSIEISGNDNDYDDYPPIDFSNRDLWL